MDLNLFLDFLFFFALAAIHEYSCSFAAEILSLK